MTVILNNKPIVHEKESDLQISVVCYLQATLPKHSLMNHSPNEGIRKPWYGAKLKKYGMCKGWPDLEISVLPVHFRKHQNPGMIFIELKSAKGKLSESQIDVLEKLRLAGHHTAVCRSLEDVQCFMSAILCTYKKSIDIPLPQTELATPPTTSATVKKL